MSDKPDNAEGSIMRSMKYSRDGHFNIGSDGVLRSFGAYPEFPVLDAKGLSPAQIKRILDQMPWTQEAVDKYRGVDGRKVTDHQALFFPPDSERPPKQTPEEREAAIQKIEEMNREIRERVEKERAEGVDVDAKYACGRQVSDHDLTPRENA